MISVKDKQKCSGCGACAAVCPKQCIIMQPDAEGFLYPSVKTEKCVNCGLCEKTCPVINHQISNYPTNAFASKNKNENIRTTSSSGGIFFSLADRVIMDGGVVYGAAFSDDFKSVRHIKAETPEGIELLKGSKYLQSETGNCFAEIKKILDSGKTVLFSGTPCQNAGLMAYLQKDYENLIMVDIICHGVPSPLVWKKYLEEKERVADSRVTGAYFRDKKYGWKKFALVLNFGDSTQHVEDNSVDIYMRGFLSDLYLRPSCYECAFKSTERYSDITLADFWGIQNVLPEMDDDRGVSLVLINTQKGKKLFESVDCFENHTTDLLQALSFNPAAVRSSKPHKNREKFFGLLGRKGVISSIKICLKVSFKRKVLSKIKRIIKRVF